MVCLPVSPGRRLFGGFLLLCCCCTTPKLFAQTQQVAATSFESSAASVRSSYKLGPEDALTVVVQDEPTILPGPYAIDLSGQLKIPELGSIHAAGLTLDELSAALTERAKAFLQHPVLDISVTGYHSQRVSVLGEVNMPGVQQIKGRKNLFEAISEAGGLKPDAGGHITLTRKKEFGAIPLPGAKTDISGSFSLAEVSVDDLMNGRSATKNVELKPEDMITVARAKMIYVIGAVNRAGGFDLPEKDTMSVLQAIALAQGTGRAADMKKCKILRAPDGEENRQEITFDLAKVRKGEAPDLLLHGDDILFLPVSGSKNVGLRTLDTLVATGSGVAMYHVY